MDNAVKKEKKTNSLYLVYSLRSSDLTARYIVTVVAAKY